MALPRAFLWIFFPLKKPKGDQVWQSALVFLSSGVSLCRLETIQVILILILINNKVIDAIK